ncbi:hypothetical protein [Caballeronia zhejiangensis]|uniref:hypothetical protein n=1 Tax=Caballeronia zhejiangensis TaxID=871203 RepID=UPI001589BA90|nr:hypothetical protein [Caballeronia zhejiangensis]MCI1042233.1 hypothetical protein [Caballeronia zhejiangensis]
MEFHIPKTDISNFIAELASEHGVKYVETGNSALAKLVSELSDSPASPDETEKLVIALRQAKVIDGPTMVELLGRYFDELNAPK